MFDEREQKILSVLSWHIWKSGLELVAEGVGRRGTIYVWLNQLESKGLIVSRERALTNERRACGDCYPQREYKLTENGIRCRHEGDQKEDASRQRLVVFDG